MISKSIVRWVVSFSFFHSFCFGVVFRLTRSSLYVPFKNFRTAATQNERIRFCFPSRQMMSSTRAFAKDFKEKRRHREAIPRNHSIYSAEETRPRVSPTSIAICYCKRGGFLRTLRPKVPGSKRSIRRTCGLYFDSFVEGRGEVSRLLVTFGW